MPSWSSNSIFIAAACLCSTHAQITPGDYQKFTIDFDLPAYDRYNEVYAYFEPLLAQASDYWWNTVYNEEKREWFRNNISALEAAQPDAYAANLALADLLGVEVAQTFGVSAITEISTYCTSIVARNTDG